MAERDITRMVLQFDIKIQARVMTMNEREPASLRGSLEVTQALRAGFTLTASGLRIPAVAGQADGAFSGDETGMVLSVCSLADGAIQALGTGFLVLPGLAMTAAHVVADYQAAGRLERGPLMFMGRFGDSLRAWVATRIRQPERGDVALVELAPRFHHDPALTVNHVELTARLPAIGEPLLGLGLIAQAEAFPFDPDTGEGMRIQVEGLIASGTVKEIYPHRGFLMPGPAIRCDFKAPGGMSGGPVFDHDGRVVGLVSSSMQVDGEWETYVSLHWPALLFETHPNWPEGLYRPATLWPGHVAENWRLGIGADGLAYFDD